MAISKDKHSCGRIDFQSPLIPAGGLVFSSFDKVLTASTVAEIPVCLAALQRALDAGYHAFCLICYESASAFDPALQTHRPEGPLPLLWFGLSRNPVPRPVSATTGNFSFGDWTAAWDWDCYAAAFAEAKRHIYDGDTYQINLTFPLTATFTGDPAAAYRCLCRSQAANYCAFLQTASWSVLSLSPELFVEWRDGCIHTRPMKGTRPRGLREEDDAVLAQELMRNPKDRAENVMIVDLLRNDLGRLAQPGSVGVPSLFTLEKYPTVWQMTSTVTAALRPELGIREIFAAIFPCGSVTGAPKVRTMALIKEAESCPRGIYCGAMGYLSPGGDGVFNVPIRTVTIHQGQARYPVGSGVVADSDGRTEYEECLLKARVLMRNVRPSFDLLETILWRPGDGYFLLDRHLSRLSSSAAYFDYPCDLDRVRGYLLDQAVWTTSQRVRLLLGADGTLRLETVELADSACPFRQLRLAAEPICSDNIFLYHKTTYRQVYAPAVAERTADTEVLLHNERGELTESTIANLALKLEDGKWYTPPLTSGLLAGTMRAELCANGTLHERVLYVEDLERAAEIQLMNSVRGCFSVFLVT